MTSATRSRSRDRRDPSQRNDEQQAPAAASQAPTTATLRLSSKPGSFGPVRLQQLVLIEVAAGLLLVAWIAQKWLVVPAAVVAGLLTLLALVRRRQHPLSEWYELKRELRRRKRGAKYPIPAAPIRVWCRPSSATRRCRRPPT